MALEPSTKGYPCNSSKTLLAYFNLLESRREKARHPESVGEEYPQYWRVCVDCERRLRLEDWARWTQTERDDDPTYCEPNRIDRDLKLLGKGKLLGRGGYHIRVEGG